MKCVILGTFPGLNEFIDANRISRGRWNKGNSMKQRDQKLIASQLPKWRADGQIRIHYTFFCPNRKKDLDNVSGYFHKVFQDALVAKGIIPNDSWKYIRGFSDEFYVDRDLPRVEVEITEA